MKRVFTILLFVVSISKFDTALGQFKKLKEKVSQKIDRTIDKAATPGGGKNENESSENKSAKDSSGASTEGKTGTLKSYSRYDFVPGDKIIYSEDFSQDVIGELPLKWNSSGSGELVTIEGLDGKWLEMKEQTTYTSPFKIKLPDNYTVECDMLIEFKEDQRVAPVIMKLIKSLGADASGGEVVNLNAGIVAKLIPNGGQAGQPDRLNLETYDAKGQQYFSNDDMLTSVFTDLDKKGKPIHVALWVQKERLRLWLNETKIYDLPKAVAKDVQVSQLVFQIGTYGGPQNNYHYYLSNIKIAAAPADTRSKLITEGKWVTTGITFDVNSDKIKESSYGTLKEIATVLNENPTVKVKIIGHTDSDGDDAKNLDLSKHRAASVKSALSSEFKIDSSRMETDGMGETKPVGDNKTPEGKAQNRRVEFVKL